MDKNCICHENKFLVVFKAHWLKSCKMCMWEPATWLQLKNGCLLSKIFFGWREQNSTAKIKTRKNKQNQATWLQQGTFSILHRCAISRQKLHRCFSGAPGWDCLRHDHQGRQFFLERTLCSEQMLDLSALLSLTGLAGRFGTLRLARCTFLIWLWLKTLWAGRLGGKSLNHLCGVSGTRNK